MSIALRRTGQRDSAISYMELAPGVTVGDWGCLACSICAILPHYGILDGFPLMLSKFKSVGALLQTGDLKGSVNWDGLREAYPSLSFMGRFKVNGVGETGGYTFAEAERRMTKLCQAGVPPLVHIDVTGDFRGDHFIVLIDPDSFTCFDPWKNEIGTLSRLYGNPEKIVTGFSVLLGKPVDAAEPADYVHRMGDIDKGTAAAKVMEVWNELNDRGIKDSKLFYLKEAAEELIM